MRVIAYGVLVSIVFVVLFGYSKAKQTAVVSNCAEQVSVRDGAQSYAEEMSTCLAQNNDLFVVFCLFLFFFNRKSKERHISSLSVYLRARLHLFL